MLRLEEFYANYDKAMNRIKQHEKDGFTCIIQPIHTNDEITFWCIRAVKS